jgi:Cu+-exporting ATPase
MSAPPVDRAAAVAEARTELVLGGMTCGACANRIERKLNKLDGVRATVNYATEKATVTHPEGTGAAELIAAIEAAGYTAALPPDPAEDPAAADQPTRR